MPKNERGFQYQKRTVDDVKQRAASRGGGFDTIYKPQFKTYKVKDGKNLVRILPPTWEGARHYGYDIFVNYGIGADKQSYLSLSKMGKGKDPIAEARREAEAEGNEELTRELRATPRILMWIVDRDAEEEGPQLWAAPITVDKALANLSVDEDTGEIIHLDDPEEGCDFRFYREGKGMLTKYDASKMKLLKPSPIHADEGIQQEWLDFVVANTLPSCLNFYDYAHISSVFNGSPSKGGEDEDVAPVKATRRVEAKVEEQPETPRARLRPRVQPKPEPVEVTEDEPPFDEDAEPEAEKPKVSGESIRDKLRRSREAMAKRSAD